MPKENKQKEHLGPNHIVKNKLQEKQEQQKFMLKKLLVVNWLYEWSPALSDRA